MKIRINDEESQEVRKIYIEIGDKNFRLVVNNMEQLEINKHCDEDGAIHVLPCYSNEIKIV